MLKRIFKYLLAAVIVCYTLFALIYFPSLKREGICQGVLVNVNDSELGIISRDEVMEILKEEGLDPSGRNINDFHCCDIENFMDNISLIEKCEVYKSIKGYAVIDIDCRIPIIKVYDKIDEQLPFNDVKDEIKNILIEDKYVASIEEISKKAKVEKHENIVKKVNF